MIGVGNFFSLVVTSFVLKTLTKKVRFQVTKHYFLFHSLFQEGKIRAMCSIISAVTSLLFHKSIKSDLQARIRNRNGGKNLLLC